MNGTWVALHLACVLGLGLYLRVRRLPEPRPPAGGRAPFACAAAFAAALLLLRWVKGDFPVTGDEFSCLFQARLFSGFRLHADSPPLRELFDVQYLVNDGRWYSKYFPGWPLVLALGAGTGLSPFLGPAAGAAALAYVYRLGALLYDRATGEWAAVAAAGSWYFLRYCGGYLPQPLCLLLACAGLYYALRWLYEPDPGGGLPLLAGSAAGMLVLTRPYDALLLVPSAWAGAAWLFSGRVREKPRGAGLRFCLLFLLPCAVCAGLELVYNRLQTGSALLPPFWAYNPADRPGFGLVGLDPARLAGHSPGLGVLNVAKAAGRLFLALPALVPVVALLRAARGTDARDRFLLLLLAVFGLGYLFYFYADERYFFTVAFALFLLIGRLCAAGPAHRVWSPGPGFLVCALALHAACALVPMAREAGREAARLSDPYAAVRAAGLDGALVFLRTTPEYPPVFFARNTPGLDGPVLYARYETGRVGTACLAFPGRKPYVYDFDPAGGKGRVQPLETAGTVAP